MHAPSLNPPPHHPHHPHHPPTHPPALSGKNIMIATGSEVTPLPGVPIDEEK